MSQLPVVAIDILDNAAHALDNRLSGSQESCSGHQVEVWLCIWVVMTPKHRAEVQSFITAVVGELTEVLIGRQRRPD